MKLSKSIYALAAAAVLGLTTTSCDDFLDKVPDNRVDLTTTEQLRQLMNAAYPSTSYGWPCELSCDNMEDNNAPDENGLRYNLPSYERGDEEMFAWEPCKSNTDNDSPSGIWKGNYLSIAHANQVLEKLEEMAAANGGKLDDTQLAIKGEALVLRSYCHFILANVFCQAYAGPELSKSLLGIPYSKEPEKLVKPHYERGNLADTYANIQADLEEGLPLISNGLYEIPKYHFNVAAANAYAARFYLFVRNYEKSLECANKAFGGEDVDVSTMLCNIWDNLGNFYYISDFGKFNQNIDKAHNLMLLATYSISFRHYTGGRRYAVIRNGSCGTIRGSGPSWVHHKFVSTKGSGGSFSMNACFNGACGVNGNSEYGQYCAATISEQFEYSDKVAGIGYAHVTRPEFTTDELLLTRAEAKLFLGDKAGCFADLKAWDANRQNNTYAKSANMKYEEFTPQLMEDFYNGVLDDSVAIRTEIARPLHIDEVNPSATHKLTPDMVPYLQCVQHFRRIETVHLGMRWFDIKRLGIEFSRKIGKDRVEFLALGDERRAIQIPQEVIAAGMQPNPSQAQNETKGPSYVVVNNSK